MVPVRRGCSFNERCDISKDTEYSRRQLILGPIIALIAWQAQRELHITPDANERARRKRKLTALIIGARACCLNTAAIDSRMLPEPITMTSILALSSIFAVQYHIHAHTRTRACASTHTGTYRQAQHACVHCCCNVLTMRHPPVPLIGHAFQLV